MLDPKLLPTGYEVTEADLRQTPPRVIRLLVYLLTRIQILEEENAQLKKRVEVLEARLNQNSANSSKPPSSDSPYAKKPEKKEKGKAGAKKGHKGHRQEMLRPTVTRILAPPPVPAATAIFRRRSRIIPFSVFSFQFSVEILNLINVLSHEFVAFE